MEREDAERAIRIVGYYLSKVAREGGVLDIDRIAGDMSHSQRAHVNIILDIAKKSAGGEGISIDEITIEAERYKIDAPETRRLVEKLLKAGELFEVKSGVYRTVQK